jgi:hypothetical protein
LADPVRIGTGTIASNNLNPWMAPQPISKAVSLAIRQQVDHRIAFQIDKNGSIPAATAPGPVVHRQDAGRRWPVSMAGGFAHQSQQRIRTGRHGQPLGQPHTRLAAQRQSEVTLKLAQALGALCKGAGGIGQRFGECLAGASRIETAETSRLHTQRHRPTLPGQIAERALIMAMDAPGNHGTAWARRRLLTRASDDGDLIRVVQNLVDHKAGRDERQQTFGQERLSTTTTALSCEVGALKIRVSSTQAAGDPEIRSMCRSEIGARRRASGIVGLTAGTGLRPNVGC